jgi:hypothetical protein
VASYIVCMATNIDAFTDLSDGDLVARVVQLAQCERTATATLIASLVEFDQRRLYLPEGFPSLFAYCTQRLHLSEHAAYHRIEAARAVRLFPVTLGLLEEGALTLTAVGLLRPHLTEENHREVLEAAKHQNKRAVEELVARLHARPDARASVRKLPQPRILVGGDDRAGVACDSAQACAAPALLDGAAEGLECDDGLGGGRGPQAEVGAPSVPPGDCSTSSDLVGNSASARPVLPIRPAVVRPLAPTRYQVQITVSAETHAKLRHAQDLLRHAVPNGDPAVIFDRALTLLVEQLERTKCAATKRRTPKKLNEGGERSTRRRLGPGARNSLDQVGGENGAARAAASSEATVAGTQGRSSTGECARETGRAVGNVAPPSRSRRIPAQVKREVWARDGGQCAFVGAAGRCPERGFLEYHHAVPFAAGGAGTTSNISVRCKRHNAHEAERFFGAGITARRRGSLVGPDRVGRDSTTDLVAPASVPAIRRGPEPTSRR